MKFLISFLLLFFIKNDKVNERLESAFAGGAILGAPLIIFLGKKFSFSKLLIVGIFFDGITYLPLFFIKKFELALILIFFHSIFIPMITVSRTTDFYQDL